MTYLILIELTSWVITEYLREYLINTVNHKSYTSNNTFIFQHPPCAQLPSVTNKFSTGVKGGNPRGRDKWEIVVVPAFDGGGFRSSLQTCSLDSSGQKLKKRDTYLLDDI